MIITTGIQVKTFISFSFGYCGGIEQMVEEERKREEERRKEEREKGK